MYTTEELQNVYLPPSVSKNWNQLQSREYQHVQVPPSSAGRIHLDTTNLIGESDSTNILVSSVTAEGNTPNTLFKNVSKVAVETIYLPTGQLDNVTTRNNQIKFETTNDPGTVYTAFLAPGRYENVSDLMDEIVLRMNEVEDTGNYAWQTENNRYFTKLTSGVGEFRILPDSSMVVKGEPLVNLPSDNSTSNVKDVGPINLLQTKYIEVFSLALSEYSRIPSLSNGLSNSSLIARVFLLEPKAQRSYNEEWVKYEHLNFFYVRPDQSFTSIDFQLRDQFGDYLKVRENPNLKNPKKDSFNWQLTLVVMN